MTGVLSQDDAIVRLLNVPSPDRDLEWIKQSLQAAIAVELSTIPPYLCAFWSIKNPDRQGPSRAAARVILSILYEEMRHLGMACNMLNAVGGEPAIVSVLPEYPGHLPGGVQPDLTVALAGLSKDQLRVFMQIESPVEPLALAADQTYPSIGRFYEDLLSAFTEVRPAIAAVRQHTIRVLDVTPITSLDDVTAAITSINEQGEGTTKTPEPNGDLAHYYQFGEMYHEHALEFEPTTGEWGFTGRSMPFPPADEIYPLAPLPAGGWPSPTPDVQTALDRFNTALVVMLTGLETAWITGDPGPLHGAIAQMMELTPLAVALLQMPNPDLPGTVYGPDFRINSLLPAGSPPLAG